MWSLLLALLFFFPQGGNIKGKVVADIPDQRRALPGVVVTLSGNRLGDRKLQSVTDSEGQFDFTGLIAGDYTVTVEFTGFKKYEQKLSVQIEATVEHNVLLQPVPLSESVTVTDDPRDPVKTESTTPSVLTTQALRDAPLIDQKFQDALPLLPGVVRGPDGNLNIKGTRPTQSGILVSSLNVTDLVTGTLPRPRWRDGKIFGIGAATPRVAVGGPIKKDKLFFFQSVEYRFVRNEVPSLKALNEQQRDIKRESFDSFSRIDYVINPNNRLTGSFSLFPQKFDYFNLNTFNPSDTTANFHQRGWFLALNEQATFQSGALLQSSFSAKQFDGDIFGNSAAPYLITPDRNFGGWFDRQHRESRRYELLEIYNFQPQSWRGSHAFKAGLNFSHTSFEGTDRSNPVTILRANGTRYQLIDFTGAGVLERRQNEFSAFLQDKWIVNKRVVLDLGLRYDRDQLGEENNFAPRLGLVFEPTASGRTIVRGGIGLFYDKISLNIGAFEQYQSLVVTTFAGNGTTVIDGPRVFRNTAAGDLNNPYSLAWNLQVDHELNNHLLLRLGYEERDTRRDFVLEPVANQSTTSEGLLLLENSGRSRYRELQALARFRFQEGRNIYLSYVRSQSLGNLNDFNTYFGNQKHPVIRPDEYGKQPYDVPHRLLFWGDFGLPFDIVATPALDWHSGFPFSLLNEQQDFVGPRNAGGRFPQLMTLDVLVTKGLSIPFRGKKYKGRAGLTVFNITNHWNPRDVQNNLDAQQFGTFYNSADRGVRLKFEFVKY